MSADTAEPCVLALPLRQARAALAAAGWAAEAVLQTRGGRPGTETGTEADPSLQEEWRVIRQRVLGPGRAELLVAPEMRPTA